jgi:hypothetical protein
MHSVQKKKTAVGVSNYALQEMLPVYDTLQRRGIPLATIDCFFLKKNKIPKEQKRKSHG